MTWQFSYRGDLLRHKEVLLNKALLKGVLMEEVLLDEVQRDLLGNKEASPSLPTPR